MGFLDSIGQVLSNPQTLMAIATMNPAIIATVVAKQLVSQIGQQLIQQLGQEMGLPQPMIDMAQGAFASSMGDVQGARQNYMEAAQGTNDILNGFFDQVGASPVDRGRGERAVSAYESDAKDVINDFLNSQLTGKADEASEGSGGSKGKGKGSILMQIAVALGKSMDDKMTQMAEKTDQIGNLGSTDGLTKDGNFNAKGQSQYGELTGEVQALGQELKLLSDALSNTLKSIGEASSKLASKQ